MNLVELIEYISYSDSHGLLTIKPYNEIEQHLIDPVVVMKNSSLNADMHGDIKFESDIWRDGNRSINFSELPLAAKYEVKTWVLLAYKVGLYEGGAGNKFQTVALQSSSLIKLCKYLHGRNIDSLMSLNQLPDLVIRNHFANFISEILHLKSGDKISSNALAFFQDYYNYRLLNNFTCDLFWAVFEQQGLSLDDKSKRLSHSVVPTNVLKSILSLCEERISAGEDAIKDWEAVNDEFVEAIRTSSIAYIPSNGFANTSTIINKCHKISRQAFYDRLRPGFEALDNLKLYVFMCILTFTGMRKAEALSCEVSNNKSCAIIKDGKYYIEAYLTKTDDTKIKMPWVTNKDTYDAVKLLERYVLAMHKRAKALLECHRGKISDNLEHRLSAGLDAGLLFGVADNLTSIAFMNAKLGAESIDPSKQSKFSLFHLKQQLTVQDLDQLESLGCNYKAIRGNNKGIKYHEGELFHITPHMLRHTFAWFIIANRLGKLDDIKYQFKHLASSMTMVYAARGYESMEELIGLFEDFAELLIDNIADEIAQEAADGTLSGGGGVRFNKGAKSLVFGVSGSKGSDAGRVIKQIHFKDLNAYKDFLRLNLRNIRGLPHGYCTAGPDCKLKNVSAPEGCVYCPSYVVTERQRTHWLAMQRFAYKKLSVYEQLPQKQQEEYALMAQSWRDTRNAANVILTDSKPLKVKEAK